MPVHWVPLRLPFFRWYNTNVRCNYHTRNPSHSIENCSSLKHEVQSLIKDGKLKFKESNGLVGVEDPSREKTKMRRQEKKAPREASFGKTVMPSDEISIAKIERGKAGYSSTTEGSKERLCKPNKEEEKKTFQHMMRELELMLKEQKEYSTALREEYHRKTLGQGQTSESDDV